MRDLVTSGQNDFALHDGVRNTRRKMKKQIEIPNYLNVLTNRLPKNK